MTNHKYLAALIKRLLAANSKWSISDYAAFNYHPVRNQGVYPSSQSTSKFIALTATHSWTVKVRLQIILAF